MELGLRRLQGGGGGEVGWGGVRASFDLSLLQYVGSGKYNSLCLFSFLRSGNSKYLKIVYAQ